MKTQPLALALVLSACVAPTSQSQREQLSADLRDAIDALRPWIGDDVQPWIDAATPILDALATGQPVLPTAFAQLRAQEPRLKLLLQAAGRTAAEADSLIAILRIALRHVESSMTP